MPSTPEKNLFFSRVLQRETIEPVPPGYEDELQIKFYIVKRTRSWYDNPLDYTHVASITDTTEYVIFYSCRNNRWGYTEAMTSALSSIGVPQEEQPTILDKLFGVLQTAFPQGRILVMVAQVDVRLLGNFDDLDTISALVCDSPDVNFCLSYWVRDERHYETHVISGIDFHGTAIPIERLSLQSFEAIPRIVRFTPATRSSIESLQKVRLDSLEEATIRRSVSCSICKEDFAQGCADQLVICLPCAHCYHADCIVSWLEVNHLCPLCRYAMPTVEESQPSNLYVMEAADPSANVSRIVPSYFVICTLIVIILFCYKFLCSSFGTQLCSV